MFDDEYWRMWDDLKQSVQTWYDEEDEHYRKFGGDEVAMEHKLTLFDVLDKIKSIEKFYGV